MVYHLRRLALLVAFTIAAAGAHAQGYSLLTGQGLRPAQDRESAVSMWGAELQPLVERAESGSEAIMRTSAQSLFVDQHERGFFAPLAERIDPRNGRRSSRSYARLGAGDPEAAMVRHLIADAEAGPAGYDAVQHGARRKPSGRPTDLTLGEIFAWIDATPGQPHAIGRYQFIPSTLARLVTILDAGPNDRFTPDLQDRMADILLEDAGFSAYRAGEITRTAFMNNLAKIWAGFPNSSGRSHYHGYAGNSATMSWASFESEMDQIFRG
ncbi:hypothetical protein SAMN04488020_101202 [Palleronia marisminoris]|uniref:Uncharacterized protein n=1 Tax=Palleronia marisminoris TaxID=315423 RepID=A0A1Y5RBP4_9RHOB|nr:hypothetical protein [Palleronia marisminoris]SFG11457.1 hypothetical protein SAMN04488020_101202 [Palleronia marisminoris]SLN13704.1 hypothetical protein PAM7066_00204 [Palleronia marisminoris]